MEKMTNWVLRGGRVLGENGLEDRDLMLADGLIAPQSDLTSRTDARVLDMAGLWLLPGIVDVHGDAIERIIMPRAGVTFPLPLALAEADRQMLANGITTAYHGLTISWEPGLRNIAVARQFVQALAAMRERLAVDTKLHFRWEIFALDDLDEVAGWLAAAPGAILSVNDHTAPYQSLPPGARKIRRMAERMGITPEECVALIAATSQRADEVPAAMTRMITAAKVAGLPVFAHDEPSPELRMRHRAQGIGVCEFPMTEDTARAARAMDEPVVFGAPNVLRGGSQNGAVDATPAILSGLGTVLASDYYYPSQLRAGLMLALDHGQPLQQAWAAISANAARAAGLQDRGHLRPGLRGDVIAVCPRDRAVRMVFVGGERRLSLD